MATPPQSTQEVTFARNVGKLLSGTVAAQAVGALSIPAIALVYVPEVFGRFSVFWAVGLTVGSLSSLRYERAIVVAEDDITARRLLVLCNRMVLAVATATTAVFLFATGRFGESVGTGLIVLAFGFFQQRSQSMIREGEFGRLAKSEIASVLTAVLFQILVGLFWVPNLAVLMAGAIAGRAAQLWFVRGQGAFQFRYESQEIVQVAKLYKDYPRFSAPYSLVSLLLNRSLILVGAIFLSAETVGVIALASRLTYLPVTTTLNAVRRVHVGNLAKGLKQPGIQGQTASLVKTMALLATPAAFGIGVLGPWVVNSGLFSEWIGTGTFIQLLLPGAVALLITAWLDRVYEVANRQRDALVLEAASTAVIVGVFWALLQAGATAELAVGVFGALVAVYNLIWLIFTWKAIAGFDLDVLRSHLAPAIVLLALAVLSWTQFGSHLAKQVLVLVSVSVMFAGLARPLVVSFGKGAKVDATR